MNYFPVEKSIRFFEAIEFSPFPKKKNVVIRLLRNYCKFARQLHPLATTQRGNIGYKNFGCESTDSDKTGRLPTGM
ncbi:hypothetical protein C7B76_04790 [filamentous cyanobacterium CCP2]|nr:hypothetical protein C7B76_04790 [filamentous cyanobacterium CCP2]